METILQTFKKLSSIDSLSFKERKMADDITGELVSLGFEVTEDNAGQILSGESGNIYGFLKGTLPGKPLLFSAHLDTVGPGLGKKAATKDGDTVYSEGDTVLGADDLCGVISILEAVRQIKESGREHRDIEVLFTVAEEVFSKGSAVLDYSGIKAGEAYVADLSGDAGAAAVCAPSIVSFKAKITGKAAHAGFEPENGIHALKAAADAVCAVKCGRIDDDMTVNIGKISGGEAVNIVPESCVCEGEVRSFVHSSAIEKIEEIRRVFNEKADMAGASCEFTYSEDVYAFSTDEKSPVVKRFVKACEAAGIKPQLIRTFGGSDHNNFARQGIQGIVISCGMYNVHSTAEYAKMSEIRKAAEIIKEIICGVD